MVMILCPAEGNIVARIRMGETTVGVVVTCISVRVSNCGNFRRVTPLNRKWMTEAVIARLSNYRVRRSSPAPQFT